MYYQKNTKRHFPLINNFLVIETWETLQEEKLVSYNQFKVFAASVRSPFAIAFVRTIGLKLSRKILDQTEAKISFKACSPKFFGWHYVLLFDRDWLIRLSYLLFLARFLCHVIFNLEIAPVYFSPSPLTILMK